MSVKLLRKSANSKTSITQDHPRTGDVYYEFDETWEKPMGDERGKHKRRTSQAPTGRRYRYINTVSWEFVEDTKKYTQRDILRGCLTVVRPEDFTCMRLKEV